MAPRIALPVLTCLLAAGCGQADPLVDDTGFMVAVVVPVDNEMDVLESINPELRVNRAADPEWCNTETVRLVRVGEGDMVVRSIDLELEFLDEGRKVGLSPAYPLLQRAWYMVTVRSGEGGCRDTGGNVIRPFSSRFYVP